MSADNKEKMIELWKQAQDNRAKLDSCKRHKFIYNGAKFGSKLHCEICGGNMDAVQAFRYCQGYEAAGGNPNLIIKDFREEVFSSFTCEHWTFDECLYFAMKAEAASIVFKLAFETGKSKAQADFEVNADRFWHKWRTGKDNVINVGN